MDAQSDDCLGGPLINPHLRPPLKYRGGKSRELTSIAPFIPHDFSGRYMEPFVGGGAMFWALGLPGSIINDINEPLMRFYRALQRDFDRLYEETAQLQTTYRANRHDFEERKARAGDKRVDDANEDLYYRMRDEFNRALHGNDSGKWLFGTLYYFINKTAYSGMIRFNSKGDYNVPYGRYKNFSTRNLTDAHHTLLTQTDIRCGSYNHVFDDATADDFIFLDPPYDATFHDYGNQTTSFGVAEHRQLAEKLRDLPCRWTMAISETPLTGELYKDNIRHRYGKKYAVNIRNRFTSKANHIIVTNWT